MFRLHGGTQVTRLSMALHRTNYTNEELTLAKLAKTAKRGG